MKHASLREGNQVLDRVPTARATLNPALDARARAVTSALIILLALAAIWLLIFKLARQPPFIDFLTMWTGGRVANVEPSELYNFASIDRAQAWLLGDMAHDRPFPYPPSSLVIFGALARPPFWVSAVVWSVSGLVAYFVAVWRLTPRPQPKALAAIAVLPGVVWAALAGQSAFVLGALVLACLSQLERRPLLAGLALGAAIALKPSVLVMAPIALIAGGHWRALAGAAAGFLGLVALSIAVYGIAPWIDWLTIAPGYLAQISADPKYRSNIISPVVLLADLHRRGVVFLAWRTVSIAAALLLAVTTFRRVGATLGDRLFALVGASFLASPYAMNYETTLLAPAAAMALAGAREARGWILAILAYIALAVAGFPYVGVYGFMAYLAFAWIGRGKGDASATFDSETDEDASEVHGDTRYFA